MNLDMRVNVGDIIAPAYQFLSIVQSHIRSSGVSVLTFLVELMYSVLTTMPRCDHMRHIVFADTCRWNGGLAADGIFTILAQSDFLS